MKKIKLFVFTICAILISVIGVNAQEVSNDTDLQSCLRSSDSVCTLSGNITSSSNFISVSSNIAKTIDFANHNITFSNSTFGLLVYTNVTLKNGTLESSTGATDTAPLTIANGSTVNLESMNVHGSNGYAINLFNAGNNTVNVDKNTVVTSDGNNAAIYAMGNGNTNTINVYGQVKNNCTSTEKEFAAINSSWQSTGIVNINIYDGAIVDGKNGPGILQMSNGTITIESGSITGKTGIVMTKGNLVVNGGNITGTGEDQIFTASSEGHVYDNGAAVYVEPTAAMDVNITGGDLVSENSYAFSAPATNAANDNLTISISDGKFTGNKGALEIKEEKTRDPFITGGQFSGMNSTHKDYLVPGYEYLDNGLVVTEADYSGLDKSLSEAKGIDKSKYTEESVKKLEEAIKAAEAVDRDLKSDKQSTIDALKQALINAMALLVEKSSGSNKPSTIPEQNITTPDQNIEEPTPNTYDAGSTYVGLATIALGTALISIRKLRNN